MMTIQIAHINIHIDFKFEKDFNNLESYETDEKSDYFIESHVDSFPNIEGKKISETEFYDLYEYKNSIIQIQKSNTEIIGYI
ncbi:MAG: hypothetical protein K2I88_01550, partial [Anaeroplasmataceae bacterium]|nr:hypothetical protein [Anaeroplasmataceae bacterium]